MADSASQPARHPPLPPPYPAVRRRPRRRRRTWPQRLVLTGSTLMAGVCVVAAIGVWYANHRLQDLERVIITHASTITVAATDPAAPGTAAPVTIDTTPGGAQNFLLLGSDSRKDSCTDPNSPFAGGLGTVTSDLSDTIILVRVEPATSQAAILSFPRDLWVTVSGTGRKAKINSAYQPDNPSRLVQTIEENFGVFIDHTVQVSLCAFKSLVDAVGGVQVPFSFPTKDDTTGFSVDAGCVTLDGEQALAYVRSRKDYQYKDDKGWHTDPTSDYGRIARQQDFISRALQKAVDKGARNVNVARDLLDVALANVVVDQNLTINDLLRLASILRGFDPAQLRAHSYRVEGRGGTQGGESVIIPDVAAPTTKAILEVFRGNARLSDIVAPNDSASTTTPGATDTSAATTAAKTTAPAAASTTTAPAPGATTTLPVVDVTPNPLGISPPDDPTCR